MGGLSFLYGGIGRGVYSVGGPIGPFCYLRWLMPFFLRHLFVFFVGHLLVVKRSMAVACGYWAKLFSGTFVL
ncbi:hypothetical protein SERLA73DRAFT_174704 [Serpula lacrymans var. lacrymans S7.3]|uniref:Uncharacterized protein n=2 Tax=Serpula lacrymans var. lacrymans TaxID=341189 RepID=F8PJP6_SERL3|nr:uncharacterized protein SERLADRAFT_456353 [Serpula lacrymans var. lacrymans S7.9]EGO03247.1 hypothetical protein SERLA73DRAFT_174704 [Serpula lacrymans var. lacrymans S7.3]EGO29030.1 hypothetical protein SERLADRAFT_456353 [Serpula lacrymans var. lacrymans S7.9]